MSTKNQTSLLENEVPKPQIKLKYYLGYAVLGLFGVLTLIITAGAVFAAFTPTSPLEGMETAFKLQNESNYKGVAAACALEVAIANEKLVQHYAAKVKQTDTDLEKLQSKSLGLNLSCLNF